MNTMERRRIIDEYRRVKRFVGFKLETKVGFDRDDAVRVVEFYENRMRSLMIENCEAQERLEELDTDMNKYCGVYCELQSDALRNFVARKLMVKSNEIDELRERIASLKLAIKKESHNIRVVMRYLDTL